MTRKDPDSALPDRLRTARDAAGLTQAQVAQKLHVHRPTISEIEAGRRRVTASELTSFARLYGVSVEWLASGEKPSQVSEEVLVAARQLTKLSRKDLDQLLSLLRTLRRAGADD